MFSLIIFSVLCCACALLVLRQRAREARAHKLPPKAVGELPIIGLTHLAILYNNRAWDLLKIIFDDCLKKGGVTCGRIVGHMFYMVTDPADGLKLVNVCLEKDYVYASPWFGDGLITSTGEIHKRHRKLIDPAFSNRIVYSFLKIFNDKARMLNQEIAPHVDKGFFNHVDVFRTRSLEIFCTTSLGLNKFEDKNFIEKYIKASDILFYLIYQRLAKFWLKNNLIYNLFGYKKIEDEAAKTLEIMYDRVIQMKKAEMSKKNECSDNSEKSLGSRVKPLLELLMELSHEDALTDKEIREEVNTAIVAGFDTTSTTLVLIAMMLGAHLDVQEKLYQELLRVLGPERDVEKDDLPKLVYTEAVIKETLRLYPPVPMVFRNVDKDVKLKNYTLRAGSSYVVSAYAMHKHPLWGPDADKFKPERWLDPALKYNPKTFFTFSHGKRSCIGKTYAMVTMKVTLSHFVRNYKMVAKDLSKLRFNLDILLKPVKGHEISLALRK